MSLWRCLTLFYFTCLLELNLGDQYTLLLGGFPTGNDDFEDYTTSIQMITGDSVCKPNIPKLPVRREMAAAELLGSQVFYCGGYFSRETPDVKDTCHSYFLVEEGSAWKEEPRMEFPRHSFGLTAVNGRLFASGGQGELGFHASVESFTHHGGWHVEDQMQLSQYRVYHCSVALWSRLVVIGGSVGHSPASSSSVEAFDTTSLLDDKRNATAGTWKKLASMLEPRRAHTCHTGELEGQSGVFVTGGLNDDNRPVASVEFYVAEEDKWKMVTTMSNPRYYHSTTIVGGHIAVAGGAPSYDSVELFNGTHWVEVDSLIYGVYRYTCCQFCSLATKRLMLTFTQARCCHRPFRCSYLPNKDVNIRIT